MNVVFTLILTVGTLIMLVASPEKLMPSLMEGASGALTFSLTLFVIYAVWLSVIKVLEKSGAEKALAKGLKPLTRRLFPEEDEPCYGNISLNLSANLLGMGGAATPMGIKAVERMSSKKNKIMLVVINSASIQIVPTTILSLRAGYGAIKDIMLPALIVNFATTALGILLVKLLVRR